MIRVNVKTNAVRKTVTTELTATPFSVLEEVGADTTKCVAILDGASLNMKSMVKTFEELGVEDGSEVTLSNIVKADSAND